MSVASGPWCLSTCRPSRRPRGIGRQTTVSGGSFRSSGGGHGPHFVLWPPPRRDFLKERGSRNCVGQRSDRRISGEGAIGAPWLLLFSTCRFTRLGGGIQLGRLQSPPLEPFACCRRRPHGLIARGNLEHGVTEDRVVLLVVAGRQRQVHVSERATLLRQRLHEPALQLDAPALRDGEDDSGIWR